MNKRNYLISSKTLINFLQSEINYWEAQLEELQKESLDILNIPHLHQRDFYWIIGRIDSYKFLLDQLLSD